MTRKLLKFFKSRDLKTLKGILIKKVKTSSFVFALTSCNKVEMDCSDIVSLSQKRHQKIIPSQRHMILILLIRNSLNTCINRFALLDCKNN